MVRVFEGHSGLIKDVSVSPDGKLMASVSWDTSLKIWRLSTGEQVQTWRAREASSTPCHSLRMARIYSLAQLIRLRARSSSGTLQLVRSCAAFGPKTIAHDVAFSPDGKTLVSAQEITVPAPPPPPLALMYAEEFSVGIAVVSDVESAKELMRVRSSPTAACQATIEITQRRLTRRNA